MKNFILQTIILTIISTSCTPTPQIKISQGLLAIDQIVNVVQNTDKIFQLENTLDVATSTSAKVNLVPTQSTKSGSLLCENNSIGAPETINCTYKPIKNFFGEDHATFTKKNIRGIDSSINVIFKVAAISSSYSPAITANDTFCSFIINQTSASCDIDGLMLNESLSSDVSVQVINDPINGLDQIKCNKVMSAGQNLKITCSLNLTKDIFSYPIQKNIKANFTLINTVNPALSIIFPKNITFAFSREPKLYTKDQSFTYTPVPPSADILWVIDNSSSMKENQASLAINFNSFINNFTPLVNGVRTSPFPFNMAAITTDAYLLTGEPQGSLCPFIKCSASGNPYLLNDSLAATDFTLFSQNFSTIIGRGIYGNGSERSLQSLQTFFSKNSNWHNPNSLLAIIMVSDEMEQSYNTTDCPLSSNPSLACSALRLQSAVDIINLLSPNPSLVNVFSIVDSSKDFSNIYKSLSDKFTGSSLSILTPFDAILTQIGSTITNNLASKTLTFQGTLNSILSVKIDGVIIPNINNQNYEIILPNKIRLKSPLAAGSVMVVNFDYTNND